MSDNDEQFNEVEKLKERNDELMNNWKRTAADFENYKKRTETERKELVEFSKEITVMKLIPSLESLEQVLIYAPADEKYKEWLAGLKATITQLEKTMEDLGVMKIKTVGQPFDPKVHEAVEEVAGEDGVVVKELQPGFMLYEKVIIPAKVAVGKEK
ncbi:MAG: nucleotide exchange factor GrpE [Candidatus Doudnabacteria bacterium]|nr:nucleotide exchange factor GrpE [Candidatus Doudnabacteria bacterium]